jgi:hypothetical protein
MLSLVNIESMGSADWMLLALLGIADAAVLFYLHLRRQRRLRAERMTRSLRSALQRANGTAAVVPAGADTPRSLILQVG